MSDSDSDSDNNYQSNQFQYLMSDSDEEDDNYEEEKIDQGENQDKIEANNPVEEDFENDSNNTNGNINNNSEQTDNNSIKKISISLPAPKKQTKKGKTKKEIEEEEIAELMKLQKQNLNTCVNKKLKESLPSFPSLDFNMAIELQNRYGTSEFEDSTRIGKNPGPFRFISRRRNWPSSISPTYRLIPINKSNTNFYIEFTQYGSHLQSMVDTCNQNDDALSILSLSQKEPFCVPALLALSRYTLFQQQFSQATDLILRLTYIIQQTLSPISSSNINPYSFHFFLNENSQQTNNSKSKKGKSKNSNNSNKSKEIKETNALASFGIVLSTIAKFASRRGCTETAASIWRFAFETSSQNDPSCLIICSPIPQLFCDVHNWLQPTFSENLSLKTFRGISLDDIPDWPICCALESVLIDNNLKLLERELKRWPLVFGSDEIPEGIPEILVSICFICKRRLQNLIEGDKIGRAIREIRKKMNETKIDMTKTYEAWKNVKGDIDISQMVEEDAFPVSSG